MGFGGRISAKKKYYIYVCMYIWIYLYIERD